ncbi:MAG: NADP-reducing hydrogenase subunit HndC [Thermotogaceae bacterium]|nr:NADP-reducing hydrogenase subunit HndC [Thermotogaceae bacterium]MDN5337802.1 NADP-reducing hydrogenase subunit HndC [Thermotogaceae bacterium]
MPKSNVVLVSVDSNSVLKGAKYFKNLFQQLVDEYKLSDFVEVLETGSFGVYKDGVIIAIYPEEVYYEIKDAADVKKVVEEHLLKGRRAKDLELDAELFTRKLSVEAKKVVEETRIVLRNAGVIDPTNINEYIARDGYMALAKVLNEMKPQEVVEVVKESGLRGRGGAGFPTGLKWEFTMKTDADQKYVICNADEGEPGTFKDRLIMEGDPHSLIEAMTIAGYAVGATKGYIYIRGEYYGSIQNIQKAIKDAYEYGLLGEDILGSGFTFHLAVRLGAGAYVCGEETALMESIEGKAGRPRLKPPYPPVSGLYSKPTVINNVETFVNVPQIILNGADWFKSIGTESSPGTKVFSLCGNIVNRGIVEAPMGTTVRDLIYKFGGGIANGKALKMVQTGGTAGTFIGPDKLDVPLDFDSMKNYGVSLGSGVILVIDEDNCAVDVLKNAMEFFEHESCGKCTPCREGTKMLVHMLNDISKGKGKREYLDAMKNIASTMLDSAFCGLGQSVPVPLNSMLNNFEAEFLKHIESKESPCGICKFEKPKKKLVKS